MRKSALFKKGWAWRLVKLRGITLCCYDDDAKMRGCVVDLHTLLAKGSRWRKPVTSYARALVELNLACCFSLLPGLQN